MFHINNLIIHKIHQKSSYCPVTNVYVVVVHCLLNFFFAVNFDHNPLEFRANYIATSNNMKLYTGRSPPRPLLAVLDVPIKPSVIITVLLYKLNGPLFCGCNVAMKGLNNLERDRGGEKDRRVGS